MIRGHRCFFMHIQHTFQRIPEQPVIVQRVHSDVDHRDRRQLANGIRTGQDLVAHRRALVPEALCLCTQHQVREIEVPLVRRHVGTLGHVTDVTHVALVDHLVVVILCDTVDLHGLALINEIEQRGERIAQADAAPAPMTDVVHTLQLVEQAALVPEVVGLPVDGVPCRCF